jgi:hypothetical protein
MVEHMKLNKKERELLKLIASLVRRRWLLMALREEETLPDGGDRDPMQRNFASK